MANQVWLWIKTHQELLQWAALGSGIGIFVLFLVVFLILIKLPGDYLQQDNYIPSTLPHAVWWPILVFKNIFGGFLVLAGLAMLVLPGQGLITIMIGLSLMNFPGKHRLIRWIMQYPPVFKTINRIRQRAGKPRLEMSPENVSPKDVPPKNVT